MSYGEVQKKEIETIAPRTFTVNLSDADVKRLYILPAIANNTIVCNAAYGGYASHRLAQAV